MNWERYKNALFGSLDKARNIGFRKRDNHIVTYEQSKLGLSAYYDKRIVHEDEFTQVVFKKKNVFQRNPLKYKKSIIIT